MCDLDHLPAVVDGAPWSQFNSRKQLQMEQLPSTKRRVAQPLPLHHFVVAAAKSADRISTQGIARLL